MESRGAMDRTDRLMQTPATNVGTSGTQPPFSVLMSLYVREDPEALDIALKSLAAQTHPADEIVMVLDGPILPAHSAVLDQHAANLPLKIVPLPENVGLARALTAGLAACSHEWVARFDTDDWSRPDRFAMQFAFLAQNPSVVLLGSWIGEFDHDPRKITQVRELPLSHEEIVRYGRRRNPFNHMTVVFRRSIVQEVGGYQHLSLMEDYWLWVRILQAGYRTANQPELLVHARAGLPMIARRGGAHYVRSEIAAQTRFWQLGFLPAGTALTNCVLRSIPRLMPAGLRSFLYRRILRTNGGNSARP